MTKKQIKNYQLLLDLSRLVEAWAKERNLIEGSSPKSQLNKLIEENGEIAEGLEDNDLDMLKDGIGDRMVVLIVMLKQLGSSFEELFSGDNPVRTYSQDEMFRKDAIFLGRLAWAIGKNKKAECLLNIRELFVICKFMAYNNNMELSNCLETAYNDIKDRKGMMHNEVYIKESDIYADENLTNIYESLK